MGKLTEFWELQTLITRHFRYLSLLLVVLFTVASPLLWGEDIPPNGLGNGADALQTTAPDFGKQLMHMFLSLAFVVAVLIIGAWLLKRLMSKRLVQMNTSSDIKILERRPLNPKAAVYLIEVYGKALLIGESPSGIHSLGEVAIPGAPRSFDTVYREQGNANSRSEQSGEE